MVRILLAIILVLFGVLADAQAESINEYNNEKLGISLKYSDDFYLIESEDKSTVTISIGDSVGHTLNYCVSILFQKKFAKEKDFDGFINNEREKYSAYKNEVTETELIIDKKYRAVEINRAAHTVGRNIIYTIVELPNKNEVLTIHMATEIEPKGVLLKNRTERAFKQYSDLLRELVIHQY